MAFGKDTGRVRGLYHGLVVSDSTDTVYDEYNEWMNVFESDIAMFSVALKECPSSIDGYV